MDEIILNESIQHLVKDQKIKALIKQFPKPHFSPDDNYFNALSKSIIYQQLSGKVAKIIYTRFLILFKNNNPTPNEYLDIAIVDLQDIGLSKQKINYIGNLSKFFMENDEKINFKKDPDEKIIKQLIAIKGIGQWTIDMFMMFTLCKPNVFPIGDLGIKKAFKKLYKLNQLPSERFMNKASLPWHPYRTVACCYLWMLVDDGNVW